MNAVSIPAERLTALVRDIFMAVEVPEPAARTVAQALVDADLEGLHSHGVMLVDMYVERLRAGSVSLDREARIVADNDAVVVLDAGNALGHITGDQAMALAIGKAQRFGAGIAVVRNAFHFGTARRFAAAAADNGCVGIAMCNTRPLMPAPGGAEPVVGNNPLAIALPVAGGDPIVLDMATSEAAMGKIRMAAKAKAPIPPNWAIRADGTQTTDAAEALDGMLLPAAGPKGFGLAFVIDLMCGLLSGGNWGGKVKPLYGDMAQPYGCSHLFIAADIAHFGDLGAFRRDAATAAERVRSSAKAPGTSRLYTPGEPEWERRRQSAGRIGLEPHIVEMLIRCADELGVAANGLDRDLEQARKEYRHAKA